MLPRRQCLKTHKKTEQNVDVPGEVGAPGLPRTIAVDITLRSALISAGFVLEQEVFLLASSNSREIHHEFRRSAHLAWRR